MGGEREKQGCITPVTLFRSGSLLVVMLALAFSACACGTSDTCSADADAGVATRLTSPSNCNFTLMEEGSGKRSILNESVLMLHRQFGGFNFRREECEDFLGWPAVQATVVIQYVHGRTTGDYMKSRPPITIMDSCSSPILLSRTLQNALDVQIPRGSSHTTPGLVMGPALSSEVAVLSPQLSAVAIPHLSYLATSEVFDDTDQYAYLFRTLPSDRYQVTALADILGYFNWSYVAVVTSANLLYGTGGLDGLRRESLESIGSQSPFCIGLSATMPASSGANDPDGAATRQLKTIVERIEADPQIKVIVLFALDGEAQRFISCMLDRNMLDYVIVGSEAWATHVDLSSIQPSFVCNGSVRHDVLGIMPDVVGIAPRTLNDKLLESWSDSITEYVLRNATNLKTFWQENPWLSYYLQHENKCQLPNASACLNQNFAACPVCNANLIISEEINSRSLYPLMFMFTISSSATEQLIEKEATGASTSFVCALANTTVDCDPDIAELLPGNKKTCELIRGIKTCRCNAFSQTQSAWPLYSIVLQVDGMASKTLGTWQGINDYKKRLNISPAVVKEWSDEATGKSRRIPESTCRKPCKPGHFPFNSTVRSTACCWQCVRCAAKRVSPGGTSRCTLCKFSNGTYQVPSEDNATCRDAPTHYLSYKQSAIVYVLERIFIGIMLLLLFITAVVFWNCRDIDLIHFLDINVTQFILCMLALANACVVIVILEPSYTQCLLAKLVSAPWINLCPGIVIVRSLRLAAIESKAKEKKIGQVLRFFNCAKGQVAGILAILLLSVLIPAVSQIFGGITLQVTGASTTSNVLKLCTFQFEASSAIYYVWQITLLIFALVTSIQVHKYRDLVRDNEGLLLLMCSVCLWFVCIALEPAYILSSDLIKPQLHFLTIYSMAAVVWGFLYGTRLFLLIKHRREL